MNFVRTILVASDHSEHARHAESRAAILGAELKADVVEVMSMYNAKTTQNTTSHVQADTASIEGADVALHHVRAAVPALFQRDAALAQRYAPRSGSGPAAIVERANEIGADLTVVAARRESFLAGLVARFRNDELIRLSDRPVLLVNRKPASAYRKVLVAVDFSAESQQASRVALALAPGALFTFLHVFRVTEEPMMIAHGVSTDTIHAYRIHAREAARVRLNRFIDALGPRKQLIYRAIEHGMPGPAIHAHAKEINADLIVVGKHGKSRFIDLFLGSVTQRLIDYSDHSDCDMLVTTSSCKEEPDMPPAA
jgi:nucleotide-binding universal stress UspA family protein